MANSWFRMYAEFATDPKVQMLSESDQRRFIMLLCLRCCNSDVTLHDEEVAFQLRISSDEWQQTKHLLQSKGLIDEYAKPCAWDRRQFQSDSSAARVREHRKRNKHKTKLRCNVTVTPPDTDTDTDTENKKPPTPFAKGVDAAPLTEIDSADPASDPPPSKPAFDPLTLPLPHCVPLAAWAAWIEYRRGRRLTCREATLSRQLRFLAEVHTRGHDPTAIIELTIRNGWQGLFEPKTTTLPPNVFAMPEPVRQASRGFRA